MFTWLPLGSTLHVRTSSPCSIIPQTRRLKFSERSTQRGPTYYACVYWLLFLHVCVVLLLLLPILLSGCGCRGPHSDDSPTYDAGSRLDISVPYVPPSQSKTHIQCSWCYHVHLINTVTIVITINCYYVYMFFILYFLLFSYLVSFLCTNLTCGKEFSTI